jgi:hypothetical protein
MEGRGRKKEKSKRALSACSLPLVRRPPKKERAMPLLASLSLFSPLLLLFLPLKLTHLSPPPLKTSPIAQTPISGDVKREREREGKEREKERKIFRS